MVRPSRVTRASARLVVGLLAAFVLATWCAPFASAHTKLESTVPAAGSTSDVPVAEVALRFTLPVTPLGDGIVVVGPAGTVAADVASAEGGLVLVATPREPLAAGDYTVTWTAAAQDGHPLEGTFGFTVAGAGPAPSESAAPEEQSEDTGDEHTDGPHGAHDMGNMDGMDHDAMAMDSPASNAAQAVARLGSAAALWGALVGAGALAFAALVLRAEDREDVPVVLRVVRGAGLLILGGLVIHVAAGSVHLAHGDLAAAVSPSAIADSLTGTTRWALGLQAVGAVAIAAGARRTVPGSWLAILGGVLVGAGHVLGGHSNTAEPRWLVVSADVAHLAAAATWVGGVVAMWILLRRRSRDGRALDAALIGARFSVVAAVAVAVVGAAGVVLAVEIVDRPEQLWESAWGILLLAKVGVVLVVGAIGAYSHFRVVPRLESRRFRQRSARKAGNLLRRSAIRETSLMVVIVLITAWLVAASVTD
ncbi:copper transport protein [Promicromonospora umidemergens]|uniref:Copper transport protein n=1 Tax=Promicromonospora umidemergens TaxID=629679 RepID=A0ABP8Y311_9MICO|nr:CopD family protein [Promicromonospora umidemergens]MCP2286767.1 copper transport protein [Promicromonospora umidemergens]